MNYELLKILGLGNLDITYLFIALFILVIILLVLLIVQINKLNKLKIKYEKFMKGRDAKSLENEITELFKDQKLFEEALKENEKDIKELFKRLETTFQKFGLIKYDAFNQMGGQLSYCAALLDENDNGFIINSVHGADGCYSYAKEIKNGKCRISLGKEEEEALSIAKGHLE